MQKLFIYSGIVLVVIGVFWDVLAKTPLGRLPGDIFIQKKNFAVYFPLASSILLSIVLSCLFWITSRR